MAKAVYVQDGANVDFTNAGEAAIAYGDIVAYGSRIAVAACDIPVGDVGTVALSGVYEMPAETSAEFTVGMKVYWNDSAKVVTATSGAISAGVVIAAKAQTAGSCLVRLG